jgi:ribonuclease G
MPNSPFVTVSQKITDEEKRKELIELVQNSISQNDGGIVRTNAITATKEALLKDINMLIAKWEKIKNTSLDIFPKEVYNAGGIITKYLVDNIDKNLDRIIVGNNELKNIVENFLNISERQIPIIIKDDYLKKFDFQNQLKKLENRKVWLKCGGFITIDKTEALTAIDVNSGKFIGKNDVEETVYQVNEQAAEEIARQIRLRDIGGIILIDFIDMYSDEHKEKIIEIMREKIKSDRSRVQVEEFTKLNLLEITRKHICSNFK